MKVSLKTKYMPLDFYEVSCSGSYFDGSPALQIFSMQGEYMMRPTVCIDQPPKPRHVMIKDWSENEGILKALIGAGVIEKPMAEHKVSQFTMAHECKLTQAAWDMVCSAKQRA